MISFVTGGATPASLSAVAQTNSRHMDEASSMPIKPVHRAAATTETMTTAGEMPPPRNPGSDNGAVGKKQKLKVHELNEFFICFLCQGYKIEATTINECMHSCE